MPDIDFTSFLVGMFCGSLGVAVILAFFAAASEAEISKADLERIERIVKIMKEGKDG
jgi:hypothetical protein